MEFKNLGLKNQLLMALEHHGFTKATQVQEMAIPVALEGKSVVVRSQTGSGKTIAFGLPIMVILQAMIPWQQKYSVLVKFTSGTEITL